VIKDIGSTITISHKNVEAVKDMLRYFYLKRYHPHPLPSVPSSKAEVIKLLATHHAAVYDLARQNRYGIRDLSELALEHFQRGADEALARLDQPANSTAKNAVGLIRMYVDIIYENDDDTWETFEGQDIPDMMKSWPLRGVVCETVARIWVRAQRWSATSAAGQAGGQEHGEEEVDVDAGDTVEDVVKEELAKLCWKYAHFAQDFARWMLIKGEVSITLGHDTMARTRLLKW